MSDLRYDHLNRRLRSVTELALYRRNVRLTCRDANCRHQAVFEAVRLWWLVERHRWPDDPATMFRRFYCGECWRRRFFKVKGPRWELTADRPTATHLPAPDERGMEASDLPISVITQRLDPTQALPFHTKLTLPQSRLSFSLNAMAKSNILWLMTMLALVACYKHEFQTLPDGVNAVNVSNSSGKWRVTVRNEHGSASDTMFAANDRQRSNIYLTSTSQLVVIEQGGDAVFFALPKDRAPEALDGEKYGERDMRSGDWRYVGVIRNGTLTPPTQTPECIALLGEGRSPYRRPHQVPHFC